MSWDSKVAWSEGMFLRAQHFQQHDRYVEHLVRGRTDGIRPYGWGLTNLRIDQDLLKKGKFAVASCSGSVLKPVTMLSVCRISRRSV